MPPIDQDESLDAYIEASAALLGISIAPEWKDGVKTALIATQGATKFVEAFPLDDDAEPAPVFEA